MHNFDAVGQIVLEINNVYSENQIKYKVFPVTSSIVFYFRSGVLSRTLYRILYSQQNTLYKLICVRKIKIH